MGVTSHLHGVGTYGKLVFYQAHHQYFHMLFGAHSTIYKQIAYPHWTQAALPLSVSTCTQMTSWHWTVAYQSLWTLLRGSCNRYLPLLIWQHGTLPYPDLIFQSYVLAGLCTSNSSDTTSSRVPKHVSVSSWSICSFVLDQFFQAKVKALHSLFTNTNKFAGEEL